MTYDDTPVLMPPLPDNDIVSRRAPLARRFPLWAPLRIPEEKCTVRFHELSLSKPCLDALQGNGLLTLGALDGHAPVDVLRQTGCGLGCLHELCVVLLDLGILHETCRDGIVPRISVPVPAFAAGYGVEELPLRPRSRRRLTAAGFMLLGELDGASPAQLLRAGRVTIQDLSGLLETMTAAGPPAPMGLLDALDAGLDGLRDRHCQVVLHRFGAGGEPTMTLAEIGLLLGRTTSRIGAVLRHALLVLPVLAGPQFGAALRELVRAVTQGADLATALSRVGRNASLQGERRPWDSPLFYERLIKALAPALAPIKRPAAEPEDVRPREGRRSLRQESARASKTRPTLKDKLEALTESLVDAVMMAIRNASLEEVLGDDVLGPTVAKSASEPDRPPRPRRARVSNDAGKHRRSVADPILSEAEAAAPADAPPPPDAAADIVDPQLLLGLDVPPEKPEVDSQPAQASIEPSSPPAADEWAPHVRLRDNETVTRLAKGGIVIRRGQVIAPSGADSS